MSPARFTNLIYFDCPDCHLRISTDVINGVSYLYQLVFNHDRAWAPGMSGFRAMVKSEEVDSIAAPDLYDVCSPKKLKQLSEKYHAPITEVSRKLYALITKEGRYICRECGRTIRKEQNGLGRACMRSAERSARGTPLVKPLPPERFAEETTLAQAL